MSILYNSILLSISKHRYQKYGDKPYIDHLFNVYLLCSKYSRSENIMASAMLHDVLEDTDTDPEEISIISKDVLDICLLLSKKHNKEYYKNISVNEEACFVKIADRVCNIRESIENRNLRMILKYKDEIDKFKLLENSFTKDIYQNEFIPIASDLVNGINSYRIPF